MQPAQCRAARALLDWTQPELAQAAGVSPSTLRDFEAGRRMPIANNLAAIRAALEATGVTFLEDGNVSPGPGVALRSQQRSIDVNETETIQYREYLENDAPGGSGG